MKRVICLRRWNDTWKTLDDYRQWRGCLSQIKYACVQEGVTELGRTLFYNCTNLESIQLPDSLVSLDLDLYGCACLKKIDIPEGVENVRLCCPFQEQIRLPGSVKDFAVYHCYSLEDLFVPEGVVWVEVRDCERLKRLRLPDSVKDYTFGKLPV